MIDRQDTIDFDAAEIRQWLRQCEFSEAEIALVILIYSQGDPGQRGGEGTRELRISMRAAAAAMGTHHSTVAEARKRLAARGLLATIQPGRPPALLVMRWDAVRASEPPGDPLDGSGAIWDRPAAGPGQSAADSGGERFPWRRFTGDDLRAAVRHYRRRGLIFQLYTEGIAAGWWADSIDARLRFLSIVHHAVSPGVRDPRAVLIWRCKAGLNCDRIRPDHEDWARRRLQGANHVPTIRG